MAKPPSFVSSMYSSSFAILGHIEQGESLFLTTDVCLQPYFPLYSLSPSLLPFLFQTGLATFFYNEPDSTYFSSCRFLSQLLKSVTVAWKAVTHNRWIKECCWVIRKPYLQKREADWIWPMGCGFLTPVALENSFSLNIPNSFDHCAFDLALFFFLVVVTIFWMPINLSVS